MSRCRSWRRTALPLLLVACLGLATAGAAAAPSSFTIGPGLAAGVTSVDPLGAAPGLLGVIGQRITVGGLLQGFTFWFGPSSGPVVVRPQLRTADGSRVIWQGAEVGIGEAGCAGPLLDCLRPAWFPVPSIRLDGSQYMIDVEAVSGPGILNVASVAWVTGDPYGGGDERALVNITPSQWVDFRGDDLAFTAVLVPEPNIVHIGYCSVAGNVNPTSGAALPEGTFLNLVADQPKTDPAYAGAQPARFVEGAGITCDPPPPGYAQQGFAPGSLHVPGNVYPYWVPAP